VNWFRPNGSVCCALIGNPISLPRRSFSFVERFVGASIFSSENGHIGKGPTEFEDASCCEGLAADFQFSFFMTGR